jgi:ribosomal protein L11 methylase PrmA
MPSDDLVDSASFRDPSGHVYRIDGRIYRTVTDRALDDFEAVRANGIYDELAAAGKVVAAEIAKGEAPEPLRREARVVLEHPRLPFISYPYEWSFAALKAAALLHLDIHLLALERGVTLSDASAYNIQFIGARPIFIDTLSFRPYREGEYWTGHRQFCEQFLIPLLLRAMFGTPHNDWYRGALDGIGTAEFTRLLPWHRKLSWNVLSQLVLPTALEGSARRGGISVSSSTLSGAKFPLASYQGLLRRLHKWIEGLEPRDKQPTTWQNYSLENSYGPEEAAAKRTFVRGFIEAEKPAMVWDLGCNAGDYSEVALSGGARYVVGWDFDQGALDAGFARAGERDLAFTPLYFDATNPAPEQGWAQEERRGMGGRGPADAVLALAFVHHLAIAKNLPLARIARWLTGLASSGVVEFVPKEDQMVQTMLKLREDIFPDYDLERFLDCLGAHATVERIEAINGRQLIWFRSENT